MSKYERLSRLLKIVTLVKANPKLNRSALAQLCEVSSVRTIQRDINSLAIANIPIYWSGEGYEIMPEFFMTSLALTVDEMLSLMLSVKTYSQNEGKFHESAADLAISKIIAGLPAATRRQVKTAMGKFSIESGDVPDIGQLPAQLYQAVLDSKQLRINYYLHDKESISEYVINPYGLAFRGRNWYLVASYDNNILAFRTDYIKTLDYTGETSFIPSHFSLEQYISDTWRTIDEEK